MQTGRDWSVEIYEDREREYWRTHNVQLDDGKWLFPISYPIKIQGDKCEQVGKHRFISQSNE
ncbi:MAG: hypothetical protein ACTHJ2_09685 [Candidatus Nitrosocosmicus sp.]